MVFNEATKLWKGISSTSVKHKQDAEWINKSREQNAVKITKDEVTRKLKSMPHWKGAGPDKIQGFWFKSFTAMHKVLTAALNECTEKEVVPGWLVERKTILEMKEGSQRKTPK